MQPTVVYKAPMDWPMMYDRTVKYDSRYYYDALSQNEESYAFDTYLRQWKEKNCYFSYSCLGINDIYKGLPKLVMKK
jgi:hypothetical protein